MLMQFIYSDANFARGEAKAKLSVKLVEYKESLVLLNTKDIINKKDEDRSIAKCRRC